MLPESWESSSDSEWAETQRTVLKMFVSGTDFVKQAMARALSVKLPEPKPPAPRPISTIETRAIPKPAAPPVEVQKTIGAKTTQEYKDILRRFTGGEITVVEAAKQAQAVQRPYAAEQLKQATKPQAQAEKDLLLRQETAEYQAGRGAVPNVPTGAMPWSPESQQATQRLAQQLRIEHPDWPDAQVQQQAELTISPGVGSMVNAVPSAMTPIVSELPESVRETPILGPMAEYAREWTSPIALAGAAVPGLRVPTAWMVAGGATGKGIEAGLEEAGLPHQVPVGPINVGPSTLGMITAPMVGPLAGRAALRGAKALPGVVGEAAPVAREALVAGERGSVPLGPRVSEEPIVPEPPVAPEFGPMPETPGGKLPGFVGEDVKARLAEMDKWAALEEIPGRPTLIEVQKKFPQLAGFVDQATQARTVAQEARTRLTKVQAAFKQGLINNNAVAQAEKDVRQAVKARVAAQKALGTAEIRSGMEDITQRATVAGADPETVRILTKSYEDANSLIPRREDLLTASELRQRVARIQATIEGTPPGVVGQIANQEEIFLSALREAERGKVQAIGEGLDALVDEVANIKYVGPSKYAEIAETYKSKILIQHPDWFQGTSPKTAAILEEMQAFQHGKWAMGKAMGYPIGAEVDNYLEQLWERTPSILESPVPRIPGKVSTAREREFEDIIEGVLKGRTPKDMTPRELFEHSNALSNQMLGQAYERRLVLERFGRRSTQSVLSGYKPFSHPLYRGWNGPRPVVDWIDQLHNPAPRWIRPVQGVAQTLKDTVFGPADFGVLGVNMLDSATAGTARPIAAWVNRALELAHLPHAPIYMEEAGLSRGVQAAMDGVVQNWGPSAVTKGQGTVLKYIPKIGEYIDAPVTAVIEKLTNLQFGIILKKWRNLQYDGNLVLLHITGEDVTNPAVRRIAADWANSLTGASRGAMLPGRRAAESTVLTSAQMGRSEMARLAQVAKGLSFPSSSAEFKMAVMTLATFGAMIYGLGSAINIMLNGEPIEFDPRNTNWATVKVGNQRVSLVSRAALIRAMGNSMNTVERAAQDPSQASDLASVWAKVVVAKVGPLGQMPVGGAGFGFEPGTGQWQMGTLSPKGRLLNLVPMPPSVEQVVLEPESRSPEAIAFNVAALRSWPVTPGEKLDDLSQKIMNKPFNDLDVFTRREFFQNPQAQNLQLERLSDQEKRGYEIGMKLEKQRQEAEATFLKMIQGNVTGTQLRDEYGEFQQNRGTLSDELYGDMKQRKAKTPEEAIAFEYWDVEPQVGADGLKDWDIFFAQREAVLQAHAGEVPVETMKTLLRDYETDLWQDKVVHAKVEELVAAEAVAGEYYKIPAFLGVSPEDSQTISGVLAEASDRVSIGKAVNRKAAILQIYEDGRLPDSLLRTVLYAERLRNPEREIFRKSNPDAFWWYSDIPME